MNLPAVDKFSPPAYQGLGADDIVLLASDDGGSLVRVIAGDVDGHTGPGSTHTPITVLHASTSPGGRLSLPWQPSYNALAYVMAGSGSVGAEQRPVHAGQFAVFGSGDRITVQADEKQDSRTATLEVIVLGGEPIGEPVVQYGPFVMNTREQLVQTIEDFQAGKLGVVPPDAIMPHVPRNR